MNHGTYNRLLEWSHGKPRPLALLGPTIAFSAEPICRFLDGKDPQELLRRCGRRDDAWEHFYLSDLALLKAMPDEASVLDNDNRQHVVEMLESGQLGQEEAFTLPFLNWEAKREALEKHLQLYQVAVEATYAMLAESDGTPAGTDGTEEELDRLLDNGAFRFVMRLVVPCFAEHMQTPQTMASEATDPREPDLDQLKDLLRLDAGFIGDPSVQRVLGDDDLDESNARYQFLGSALGRPSAPPSLEEMKCRMAGCISFIGWVLGHPVQGPGIKQLFDICSQHSDPSSLGDSDLPVGDSLRRSLSRQRKRWIERYRPDTSLLVTVRALWGDAA